MIEKGTLVYYVGRPHPVGDPTRERIIGVVVEREVSFTHLDHQPRALYIVKWPGRDPDYEQIRYTQSELEPVRMPDRADPADVDRWLVS